MVSKSVKINNPTGLSVHPAGRLCKEAVLFSSAISFSFGSTTANMKSVLSVLGAGVRFGDEIVLECSGDDENEALERLVHLIEFEIVDEE